MRMSLLLRLLLAAAGVLLAEAKISLNVTSDNTVDTLGMKERERTIAGVEASLLSLLGFTRRPRPQGSAVHIPESLRKLYLHQKKIGIADIAKPGFHTRSANTVRSFSHVGDVVMACASVHDTSLNCWQVLCSILLTTSTFHEELKISLNEHCHYDQLTFKESELDEKFQSPNHFRLSFDVSGMPLEEKLQAAELSLSRVLSSSGAWEGKKVSSEDGGEGKKKDGVLRILVHDIVRPGIRGKRKPLLRLIDSKTVKERSNMTISLDVHPAVVRWLDERDHNHGLLIQISDGDKSSIPMRSKQGEKHVRLRRSLEESNETWSSTRPTLFTYTDDGRRKMATANEIIERRERRATLRKNRRKDGREICRRHALYVDFADVGWNDWIVAPPGYDAFYCHGDCPFPLSDHLNSTNHAIVQNLVYSTNPSMVPKACCVPTALSSISMLYLDEENKVVLKNYQDMAVLGCGCR